MNTCPPRPRHRRRLLVAAGLLSIPMLHREASSAPAEPFVMGTDQPETTFYGRWLRRAYTEAFRRLGMPVQFIMAPTQRLSSLMDQGGIDGEVVRARAYATAHPDAIRVDETILVTVFGLYAADPALHLQRLEDLPGTALRAAYRRGVVFCEKALRPLLPPNRLVDVTETAQGLSMLSAGRVDVFCEIDSSVSQALNEEAPKGVPTVRKLLDLESAPNYPYLHSKHAELAPRLAATLKQMKAEGLIERYQVEARREVERK